MLEIVCRFKSGLRYHFFYRLFLVFTLRFSKYKNIEFQAMHIPCTFGDSLWDARRNLTNFAHGDP